MEHIDDMTSRGFIPNIEHRQLSQSYDAVGWAIRTSNYNFFRCGFAVPKRRTREAWYLGFEDLLMLCSQIFSCSPLTELNDTLSQNSVLFVALLIRCPVFSQSPFEYTTSSLPIHTHNICNNYSVNTKPFHSFPSSSLIPRLKSDSSAPWSPFQGTTSRAILRARTWSTPQYMLGEKC